MDSVVPVQNKNFSWDGKELAKNSRAVWKAKSHLHWQFVGICHILWRSIMESSYFHTSSIWDEWDCWKSSAQNERRDVCSIVAVRLGWKLVGCFFGMLLLSAKHSRSLVGWENALWETTWKILWRTDHSVRSNGWIFSDFCERAVKAPPIWWESLTRIMPRICIGCGRGFGQEIFWLQTDIEELGKLDASENPRSKARRTRSVNVQKKGWKVYIPDRGWNMKIVRKDHEIRESTLRQYEPAGSEDPSEKLQRNSDEPQPAETKDDVEARNDFWSMEWDFHYRRHLEPRVQLHVRKEETFPIPLKYIDVTRTTHAHLDVLQESRIDDYWNVDVDRNLSDSWTGFTKFTWMNGKPPQGEMWSGGRRTKIQATTRPDYLWPELWNWHVKSNQEEGEARMGHGTTELDNARRLRGIYFIDHKDGEYEETVKNARKKFEILMEAAMPWKMETRKRARKP